MDLSIVLNIFTTKQNKHNGARIIHSLNFRLFMYK